MPALTPREVQQQLAEVSSIQNTIFELERAQNKLKLQYEEEIMRLRRQLTDAGHVPVAPPTFPSTPAPSASSSAPSVGNSAAEGAKAAASLTALNSALMAPQRPLAPALAKRPARPEGSDGLYPGGGPLSIAPQAGGALSPASALSSLATVSAAAAGPMKQKEVKENSNGRPSAEDEAAKKLDESRKRRLEDVKPSSPESLHRREVSGGPGADWVVGYNPSVQTNLNIELAHTLEHPSVVCCVRFSADGKYLATGCNRAAQIFDAASGEKVHAFTDESAKEGADLYIRSVCFSPDGTLLAAGAEDRTVKIWDIPHKRLSQTLTGHELDIYSLDFSPDDRFIVSGSGDKKAKIWDVEKGKCLYTLGNEEYGPKDGVTSVAISPDGRLVAAGSLDRIVRLWDAQTGYFLERYEGHLDSVYSVAFSPDGKSLASGSLDKTIKLWDLSGSRSRSRCRSTFTGHKDFVLSVTFSPDGSWLVSGSKDRSVQFWDPRSTTTHVMLQGHRNSVISVSVSASGNTFATGSGDCRARLWRYDPSFPMGPQ